MKIITKEIPIDELILNVKTNYKNSEKYFLLSTKEVYPHLERWLNQYCPNLKSVTLNCFIEKVPKEFSHPLIMIEIDEKFVKKEELEKFTQMEKELFQIILAPNNMEYDNDDDFRWFIRKILDDDQNDKNFVPKNRDTDFYVDNDVLGSSSIKFDVIIRKCAASFYQKGNYLHSEGKYVDSLNFFNTAKILDETYFTLYSLALTYFKIQNYSKCIKFADESLKLNNKFVPSQILLSHCFFNEGNFDRALKEIENVDRTNLRLRDIVEVEIQLAKICLTLGYEEKSNSHFKNAEEITPEKFRPALINLILIKQYSFYDEINDYQKSSDILKILISLMPSKISLFSNLIICQINLNQFLEVEKSILQVLNLDGNRWEYLFMLFVTYFKQNKTFQALDVYNKLIKFKDKLPSKVFNIIYGAEKQLKENVEKQKIIQFDDVLNLLKSKNEDEKSHNIPSIEPHPIVSYEQLKRTEIQCLQIVRQYIRTKYSKNINLLKEDRELFSNGYDGNGANDNYVYKKIEQSLREKEESISEQRPISDLFDCMDFGFFPFIFRKKFRYWKLGNKIVNLFEILTPGRNTSAHYSGPDELGNLSTLDAQLHYVTCRKIIVYLENKMKI
jgi:tetratricopeptide (TPR) repeat protein